MRRKRRNVQASAERREGGSLAYSAPVLAALSPLGAAASEKSKLSIVSLRPENNSLFNERHQFLMKSLTQYEENLQDKKQAKIREILQAHCNSPQSIPNSTCKG
jgi:hypothetical protein